MPSYWHGRIVASIEGEIVEAPAKLGVRVLCAGFCAFAAYVGAFGGGRVVVQENVVVYAVVFGGYFIARIWRAVCDRRAHIDLASTVADQGFKN